MRLLPILSLALLILSATQGAPAEEGYAARTTLKLSRGFWTINGKRTYPGTLSEGLLFNVRMVNATFEDRNPKTCPEGFDPEANTAAFIAAIPDYVAHGVRAFTLSLQGGDPGYEGALNSAFNPDGTLRPEAMARLAKVIEACDQAGAGVILCCFYQRQDQVLESEEAVEKGLLEVVAWIRGRGYRNILLEVANEFAHAGYDHPSIRDPVQMVRLIEKVREAAPGLLVSTSGMGNGRLDAKVQTPASFLLLHFNNIPVEMISERIATARKISKAIVCNEDDKTGEEGAKALEACVDSLASWGYFNRKNQSYPFTFEGAKDDPIVYGKMKELAGESSAK